MNAVTGLTGTEIQTYIKDYVGNQSTSFASLLVTLIPLGEYRYCKMHDWNFLKLNNASLTVVSGTSEYTLDTAAVGEEVQATNVKNVFSSANGVYLKKTTLDKVRRQDPELDDGTTAGYLTHWYEAGDKTLGVYPPVFNDTTLKIDAKIEPVSLLTLGDYPTVPFRYQESFICYLTALALDRENDDRARRMLEQAMGMIKQDVADDMARLGNVSDDRIKSLDEAEGDGWTDDSDPLNMKWPY